MIRAVEGVHFGLQLFAQGGQGGSNGAWRAEGAVVLEERRRAVTENLKQCAMELANQQADAARKIVEAGVKRLTELVLASVAKGAELSSSIRVRLTRAHGLLSSAMKDIDYPSRLSGVQEVEEASVRRARRHQGFSG